MSDQRDRIVNGATITSCPTKHFALTPSTKVYNPPVHVWVGVAGNVEIVDDRGETVVYALSAESIAPVRATQVLAGNTTATGLVGIF